MNRQNGRITGPTRTLKRSHDIPAAEIPFAPKTDSWSYGLLSPQAKGLSINCPPAVDDALSMWKGFHVKAESGGKSVRLGPAYCPVR